MDLRLQLLKRQAASGGEMELRAYVAALERVLMGGEPEAPLCQFDPEYGDEAVLQLINGREVRTAPYPEEVSYIRVVEAETGREIAYWSIDEIEEDAPEVLGAIFGAALGGEL